MLESPQTLFSACQTLCVCGWVWACVGECVCVCVCVCGWVMYVLFSTQIDFIWSSPLSVTDIKSCCSVLQCCFSSEKPPDNSLTETLVCQIFVPFCSIQIIIAALVVVVVLPFQGLYEECQYLFQPQLIVQRLIGIAVLYPGYFIDQMIPVHNRSALYKWVMDCWKIASEGGNLPASLWRLS